VPIVRIHPTANVDSPENLGEGSAVWAWSQIRAGVKVGRETTIGQGCYLGPGVLVGARCKIQNSVLIYEPSVIGDAVFLGPGAVLTNDRFPRAVNLDGLPKAPGDWVPVGVHVETGASVGACAVLVGPLRIGRWAMVGAGSVVTQDVQPFALVVGSPARSIGWVGRAGRRLEKIGSSWRCPETGELYIENGVHLTPESEFGGLKF
jgi:UDP-2-acetamido-3-amino-2,3-dideoxy-glucuronate N-acetyltransferase